MKKLKYIKSCFEEFIDIDDKELKDIPINEVKDIVKELINNIDNKDYLKEILMLVMDYSNKYTLVEDNSVNCEQCGDWILFKTYNKIVD